MSGMRFESVYCCEAVYFVRLSIFFQVHADDDWKQPNDGRGVGIHSRKVSLWTRKSSFQLTFVHLYVLFVWMFRMKMAAYWFKTFCSGNCGIWGIVGPVSQVFLRRSYLKWALLRQSMSTNISSSSRDFRTSMSSGSRQQILVSHFSSADIR